MNNWQSILWANQARTKGNMDKYYIILIFQPNPYVNLQGSQEGECLEGKLRQESKRGLELVTQPNCGPVRPMPMMWLSNLSREEVKDLQHIQDHVLHKGKGVRARKDNGVQLTITSK